MQINKKTIGKTALILTAFIYFAFAFAVSGGNIGVRILKSIFSPVFVISDICYFIMPVTFLVLIILTITDLIRKNHTSLNRLFAALILTTTLGYVDGELTNLIWSYMNFFQIDFISIGLYIILFLVSVVAVYRIYNKNNTRLYHIITLVMILYCLFYVWKVINFGI